MSGIIQSTYILLRIQTPKNGIIYVEAEHTWKIKELKEFISENISIAPQSLILFFKETSLDDSNCILKYGLKDGDTVLLNIRFNSNDDGNIIQIQVKTMEGQTYVVEANTGWSVNQLKKVVSHTLNLHEYFSLFYKAKKLVEGGCYEQSIGKLGLTKNNLILQVNTIYNGGGGSSPLPLAVRDSDGYITYIMCSEETSVKCLKRLVSDSIARHEESFLLEHNAIKLSRNKYLSDYPIDLQGDTLDVIILPPVDTNNIYINVEFDNYKHYRICAYFKWTLLKVVEVCKEMNEGRCEHDSLRLYGNELDLGKTLEFYNIENEQVIQLCNRHNARPGCSDGSVV